MSEQPAKYEDSKIYCLYCADDYYYVGSTITDLRYRLGKHKESAIRFPTRKVYEHINKLGWNNVQIKLLKSFSCKTREELLKEENEHIRACEGDLYCLNINSASQTPEDLKAVQSEYRKEHRDTILKYKDEYRKENAKKIAEYNKQYTEQNKEVVKERKQAYNQANKEKIAEQTKIYRETHKEAIAVSKKEWAENHKSEIKEKSKKHREEHKDELNEKAKEYYESNKEACKTRMKEYREKNRETFLEKEKAYREKKKLEHPEVSVVCTICQGSYLPHHKKRHEASKKHQHILKN
jgi:G:T/U-mismatch repair DNA glycosylase